MLRDAHGMRDRFSQPSSNVRVTVVNYFLRNDARFDIAVTINASNAAIIALPALSRCIVLVPAITFSTVIIIFCD